MDEEFHRYCAQCGARFDIASVECPRCSAPWGPASLPADRSTAKALLELLQRWRREDLLSADSFETLRMRTEEQLGTIPWSSGEQSTPVPVRRVPAQSAPLRPARRDFGAILAARQADILLYLGAFLLAVAALIFVTYQDDALSAAVRVPVLAGYTIAGIAGGIVIRRWERVREAGHVFLSFGALLVPLNGVLLYVDVLEDRNVPGDIVWLLASVFCVALYGALAWKRLGALYRIPAAIALLSGWASLIAVLNIPPEWGGAWYMALALGVSVAAAPRWRGIVVADSLLAGAALLWSYATVEGDHHWQLAATHALATGGAAWIAYRFRIASGLFLVLLLGAATVAAGLWTTGAPSPTFAYPFLASGALALLFGWARRFPWGDAFRSGAWWYATAASLASLPAVRPEEPAWSGLGCMASAAVLAVIAWRNREHGLTASVLKISGQRPGTNWWERAAYAWVATGFAFAAAGLWQDGIGISEPANGWVFAIIACLPALGVAFSTRCRSDDVLGAAIPASLVAAFVSLPESNPLFAAAFLAMPGVAWVLAAPLSGRWTAAIIGVGLLTASTFGLRAAYDWPYWLLSLAFAATGAALFAAFTPRRRYPASGEAPVCVLLLSWGLLAVGLLVVTGRLIDFQSGRLETGHQLFALIVERGEYRVLIILVSMLAPLLAFDGLRTGWRLILLPASAVALFALLLTIGLLNPENVQAYTVPAGVYLLGVGLVIRRSPTFVPPHLQWHEIAVLAGAAVLVLPQAEQSFEEGGAWLGLVILAEGLLFLMVGMLLRARWLVPAGTLVLSGVAIRWLLESGDTVPYWVTLGLLGTLLLAGGLMVLLNAERWSRFRNRLVRWWQLAGDDGAGPIGPPGTP